MEDIWPWVVLLGCEMAFGVFMMVLNLKITSNASAKTLTWYVMWLCIAIMVVILIKIGTQVYEVAY